MTASAGQEAQHGCALVNRQALGICSRGVGTRWAGHW